MANCKTCGIELSKIEKDYCHFCPKPCEDCGLTHPDMSCYDAEKKFGKKCNL